MPGGLVGAGMLLVKESARWLAKRGRTDEALESLVWVRGGEETAEVKAEFAEILQGVENEVRATEGVTWRELLLPANRRRLAIAVSLQLCQQLTGNTSLAYYAPQIFKAVGAGDANLLITGFFGLVKLVSVFTFVVCRPPPNLSLRRHFFVSPLSSPLPFLRLHFLFLSLYYRLALG